jgi:hypothetical protein
MRARPQAAAVVDVDDDDVAGAADAELAARAGAELAGHTGRAAVDAVLDAAGVMADLAERAGVSAGAAILRVSKWRVPDMNSRLASAVSSARATPPPTTPTSNSISIQRMRDPLSWRRSTSAPKRLDVAPARSTGVALRKCAAGFSRRSRPRDHGGRAPRGLCRRARVGMNSATFVGEPTATQSTSNRRRIAIGNGGLRSGD